MDGRLELFAWFTVRQPSLNEGACRIGRPPKSRCFRPLPKWSAEQATTLLMESMNELNKRRPELFTNGVCFYGHSIGAFIGLRMSKRREELNEAIHPTSWIFESPMTGYTEIHDETCNILKIPMVLRPGF